MDSAQALAVVRSLANGVDPESGEVFPARSAYQRPLVVRALYEAASALERIERFERRKSQLPPKTGEPWSEDEDRKLLAAFDAGRALQELAAAHERTMGAVRVRGGNVGHIIDEDVGYDPAYGNAGDDQFLGCIASDPPAWN